MKKLLLHIFLLSYAVVIFRPVLPYVKDLIAHAFFYAHHMATVHYENGKYHVHYETAKDTKEENPEKANAPTSKKDNSSSEHILSKINQPEFFIAAADNDYHPHSTPRTITGIASIVVPPPRA